VTKGLTTDTRRRGHSVPPRPASVGRGSARHACLTPLPGRTHDLSLKCCHSLQPDRCSVSPSSPSPPCLTPTIVLHPAGPTKPNPASPSKTGETVPRIAPHPDRGPRPKMPNKTQPPRDQPFGLRSPDFTTTTHFDFQTRVFPRRRPVGHFTFRRTGSLILILLTPAFCSGGSESSAHTTHMSTCTARPDPPRHRRPRIGMAVYTGSSTSRPKPGLPSSPWRERVHKLGSPALGGTGDGRCS